jgi:hypothetical protein
LEGLSRQRRRHRRHRPSRASGRAQVEVDAILCRPKSWLIVGPPRPIARLRISIPSQSRLSQSPF